MKKYLKILFVAFFAVMSLAFTSCSKDDEPSGGDLVGTWMLDQQPIDVGYMQFKSNGDYIQISVPGEMWDDMSDSPFSPKIEIFKGKWTRNGDTVTCLFDDGDKTSFKIEKITSKQLHIIELGIKGVYERVPDSTIDKYLK